MFDTIVETHPTETKRDRRQSDSEHTERDRDKEKKRFGRSPEREPLGRAKCKKGLQDCWLLNKWSLWKECCVWEGKGKEKNNQKRTADRQSRKAGRQSVASLKE